MSLKADIIEEGAGLVGVPSASSVNNSTIASTIANAASNMFGPDKANAPVEIKAPYLTTEETNRVLKLSPAAQKLGIKSGVTPADSWKELIKGSYDLIYPHVVGDFRHMKDDYKVWKVASTAIKKKAPSIMKLFSIFTALEGWAQTLTDPVLGKVRKEGGINFTSYARGKFVMDKVDATLGAKAAAAYKLSGTLSAESTSNIPSTSMESLYSMAGQLLGVDVTSPSGEMSRASNTLMSSTKPAIADIDKELSTVTDLLTEVNPGKAIQVTTTNQSAMQMASQAQTTIKVGDTPQSLAEDVTLEAQCAALEKIFGDHGPLPDMSSVAVPPNGRVHYQTEPSNQWVIPAAGTNVLAQDVTVTVFDDEGFEIVKDEFYIDGGGNAVVTFLKSVAGRAVLVGVMPAEDPASLPSSRVTAKLDEMKNTAKHKAVGTRTAGGGYTPNKNKAANVEETEEDRAKTRIAGKITKDFVNIRDAATANLIRLGSQAGQLLDLRKTVSPKLGVTTEASEEESKRSAVVPSEDKKNASR